MFTFLLDIILAALLNRKKASIFAIVFITALIIAALVVTVIKQAQYVR